MAKTKKRARKRYSDAEKAKIIEAANKEKLTAAAVQKRFGVKPVTYYSWRKASKARRPTRRGPGRPPRESGLSGSVRAEIQSKVRQILPKLVQEEVDRYLSEVFSRR